MDKLLKNSKTSESAAPRVATVALPQWAHEVFLRAARSFEPKTTKNAFLESAIVRLARRIERQVQAGKTVDQAFLEELEIGPSELNELMQEVS